MKINKKAVKTFFKILIISFIVIALLMCAVFLSVAMGFVDFTSDLEIDRLKLGYTSFIYYTDANGDTHEYETIYGSDNRVWVDGINMPDSLKDAIVAIEDERFYSHAGVDLKSTSRAVFDYLLKKPDGRGASTLTQQLIKNFSGDDDRAVSRKAREIFRAISLEHKMEKDEILELYLNTIYLGQGCSGVGAASQTYFNKDVSEINLAESALLAGITQFPSRYDPVLHFDASKEKQEVVLTKMLQLKRITQEEHDEALNYELQIDSSRLNDASRTQSYFGDMVIDDVLEDLINTRGYTESSALSLIYSGGLRIYATVDPTVQKAMTETYENSKNFPSSSGNGPILESAMVVLDSQNGSVRGVIGGRGIKEGSRTLNRATQSLRQPGSTMKPIGVYAPAVENKLITPTTVFDDKAISVGSWKPTNYYSGFRGKMTVRYAVEQSVNTVAVQVLQKVGVAESFAFVKNKLNVSSLVDVRKDSDGTVHSDKNLAPLSLGGLTDGISILELASAYAPFANRGVYTEPITYTSVVESNTGKEILSKTPITHIAMSSDTAATMNSLLKGVVTNGTGRAANFRGDLDICGKTGTTDEDKDRWFVGYTPYYVGVVWTGYDQPKTIGGGANPAIPVWTKVMTAIHKSRAAKSFDAPEATTATAYCMKSLKLPNDHCALYDSGSQIRYENFPPGEAPTETCDIHQQIFVDTSTGMLAHEGCPSDSTMNILVEKNDDGALNDIEGNTWTTTVCTTHSMPSPSPSPSPATPPISPSQAPSGGYYTYNNDGSYYYNLPDGSYYFYKPDGSHFYFHPPDGKAYDYYSPNGGSYFYDGNKYYYYD